MHKPQILFDKNSICILLIVERSSKTYRLYFYISHFMAPDNLKSTNVKNLVEKIKTKWKIQMNAGELKERAKCHNLNMQNDLFKIDETIFKKYTICNECFNEY